MHRQEDVSICALLCTITKCCERRTGLPSSTFRTGRFEHIPYSAHRSAITHMASTRVRPILPSCARAKPDRYNSSRNGLKGTRHLRLVHSHPAQRGVVVVLLLSASIEGLLENGSSVLSMLMWCLSTLSKVLFIPSSRYVFRAAWASC